MSLSRDELEQIGSYFARHYHEGERVKVPDNFSDDPLSWLRKQPMFEKGKFPLESEKYSPEKNKPRILLREPFKFTEFIEKRLKEIDSMKADDRAILDISEFPDYDLSRGHFEWKTWLQYNVEQIANGKGSIKLLATEQGDRDSEKIRAFEKKEQISNLILETLEKNLLHDETKSAPQSKRAKVIKNIQLLEKINNFKEKSLHDELFQPRTNVTFPVDRVIWSKICNAVTNTLFSLAKFNHPPSKDEFKKLNFVEISMPANSFLSELSTSISNILFEEIALAVKLLTNSKHKEEIGLSKAEEELFRVTENKGFAKGNEKWHSFEKTTKNSSLGISYHILIFLMWNGLIEAKTMDWKDYKIFYEKNNDGINKKKQKYDYPHKLIFSEEFKEIIGNCQLEDSKNNNLHPIFRWLAREPDRYMYCPPRKPTQKEGIWSGGLCVPRGSIISSHSDYEEFKTPRCAPSEKAVKSIHLLQTTQWEINLDFLSAVSNFASNEESICKISIKKELENAFFYEIKDDYIERDKIERNYQREHKLEMVKRIIEHNANVFWHSWTFDFRGRMYPKSRNLSPQGDDLDKSLIRFKEWKNLGERGIFWLHVHVHNLFEGVQNERWQNGVAEKRRPFQDRDKWVRENLDELRRIGKNTVNKKNLEILELKEFRGGGSESFQRLAAIIELDRVWSEYDKTNDWGKVKSGLPIHLDASTNGYQHLAALFKDKKLAEAVNIAEVDNPHDLYKEVSEEAKRIFQMNDFSFIKKGDEYKKILAGFSESEKKFLEDTLFTRNFAKQPTMRLAYGGRRLANCFDGKNSSGNPRYEKMKKTQSQKKKEEILRSKISDDMKENYAKYESLEGPKYYRNPNWKWSWFQGTCSGGEAEARKIQNLLREWVWVRCWSEESLLYKSFMERQDELPDRLASWKENFIFQRNITELCDEIYKHSVGKVTQKSNYKLTNQFNELFKKQKASLGNKQNFSNEMVASWNLPDGFHVKNYYIKYRNSGDSSGVARENRRYSNIMPNWLKKREKGGRTNAINNKLKECLGHDEYEKIEKEYNLEENIGKKGFIAIVEQILHKIDREKENKKLDELRREVVIRNHNINQYSDKESDRLNPNKVKSSIAPNFIHSLDAYHMREIIRRMGSDNDKLDFWAVHDSFGTHACEIDKLKEIVTRSFQEFYKDYHINSLGKEISKEFWSEVKLGDFDIEEILKSEYMIS